jgi:sigma-B regulation protein RsbU (phosphoserine phosphatase)
VSGFSVGGFHFTRLRVLALAAIVLDIALTITGKLGELASAITFVLVVCGGVMLIRLALRKTRLIWHMRNRLIVTYVFIAVVPITLILALFFVAGWLLTAQFEGYLVSSALERREAAIETPARLLAMVAPADRLAIAQQLTATGIPAFEVLVTGGQPFRYPSDSGIRMPEGDWKNFTGIVSKDEQYYLMSLASSGSNHSLILVPLTPEAQANLVSGLGSVRMPILKKHARAFTSDGPKTSTFLVDGRNVTFSQTGAGILPPAYNVLDVDVDWFAPIQIADWEVSNSGQTSVVLGKTRLSALLGVVFPGKIDSSQIFVSIFYVIVALLGVAEVISLFIGVSMTRTITGAVHNLYEGTMRIGAGDFVHRIPVKGRDQLAELGHSFNKMAAQLEHLLSVAREKERLQSEIAIASEVQTRLFPRRPPDAKTVRMLGVCHAARMVSGDYYDYFTAADGELAIALGDVAGKGISAALLMASIQSIMRTQLAEGDTVLEPATVVARLNRLLYASTPTEKYATFFFGLYNEQTKHLTYTNAGHLPPLLIRATDFEFLDVTGSVVGAFPTLRYEEQTVSLGRGDLLVAYTDGITEPENKYGEEFGAARLAEIVLRHRDAQPDEIIAKILEAVRNWDTSDEQSDDMTVMVVQGI